MTDTRDNLPLQAKRLEMRVRDSLDALSDLALDKAWSVNDFSGLQILSIEPPDEQPQRPPELRLLVG